MPFKSISYAKNKKSSLKAQKKKADVLSIINPYAAGIDIGDTIHIAKTQSRLKIAFEAAFIF